MLENLLSLAKLLNNDNVETLDLTKDEDYKKFHDAVETLKSYKNAPDNSIMGLLSSFISDELLDEIEEIGELAHNHVSEDAPKKIEIEEDDDKEYACCHCDNPCSVCEKEYCDDCEFFEDTDKEEDTFKRPSEQINNVDAKLQIHRLVNEYCEEYIKPYISDDDKGKKLANDAYAGLYEFACWIYNKK